MTDVNKELTAQEKLDTPLPEREASKNVLEEKIKAQVEQLDPEDKTALFFSMYGHKLHSYLSNMSVKQIRRAYMNSLGNKDILYKPKTQEERFVSWATDKLVELKMSMQMHLMYGKLGEAQSEYEKNSGLEDKILADEMNRMTELEKAAKEADSRVTDQIIFEETVNKKENELKQEETPQKEEKNEKEA